MSIAISSKDAFSRSFGTRVLFNERLAPHLAYRVGGPADILVFPESEEDLNELLRLSRLHQLPITVLGSGTNLLVLDGGIRGVSVMLRNGFRAIELLEANDETATVRVGGGVEKAALLNWAVEQELTGLEFSSGVPGTIGGGIFMNAGTKYGCYGDILLELRLFDFAHGTRTVKRTDVHFGYREQSAVENSIVVSATFQLNVKLGSREALRNEVNRIIAERAEKQPLNFPSCGSTFKNPEGHSAGRLIERAGLKGLTVGGAQVSEKHANFILNKEGAVANDILSLIEQVEQRVLDAFKIRLDREVIVLGCR